VKVAGCKLPQARRIVFQILREWCEYHNRPLPSSDDLYVVLQDIIYDKVWDAKPSIQFVDELVTVEMNRPEGPLEEAYEKWRRKLLKEQATS
jgi:hypothetical protein